ncbi:GGDEF domain-containing protein [Hippea jasoniae]|uniref:GGDEF domain-containing protein n=1 Tax=Hippea jasoniae TaxID=944479 RepID=UPI00068FFBF5|nr:GGDEF domain-containing protein [Hippea jasoniae]
MVVKQKSIVRESLIYMLLLGVVIGILFLPVADIVFHLPKTKIYSLPFILTTVSSGIFVGSISFLIVKFVVLNRLKELEEKIEAITQNIFNYQVGKIGSVDECTNCYLKIPSRDILGSIATKYNALIRIIRNQFYQHELIENYSQKISKIVTRDDLNKITTEFFIEKLSLIGCEIYSLTYTGEIDFVFSKGVHSNLSEQKILSLNDILDKNQIISMKDKDVELVEFGSCAIKPKEVYYYPIIHSNFRLLVVFYSPSFITKEKRTLIDHILNEYKFAYESAQMYEKMQKMAAYDELTGIYNRRFGMKRLIEEYKRALRTESCFCVLMIDIDFFKKINDTYGHQAGDYILASIGKIIQSNFRAEDIVMRYGGEEFFCVMSNSNIQNGKKKAELLRKKVQETTFVWKNTKINVTISVGVSNYDIKNSPKKELDEIIALADQALYAAKKGGRNKVIVANDSF